MKRIIYFLILLLGSLAGSVANGQTGKLAGRVTDEATKEPVPGVYIIVKLDGALKGHAVTDEKGFYSVSPLEPGIYSVEFINIAFWKVTRNDVPVEAEMTRFLNAELKETSAIECVISIECGIPDPWRTNWPVRGGERTFYRGDGQPATLGAGLK